MLLTGVIRVYKTRMADLNVGFSTPCYLTSGDDGKFLLSQQLKLT